MRKGAEHHLKHPEHVVLILKDDKVHHTYKTDEHWTLGNVESLNELPPF